ncbi:dynein axonemal assembly factor 10-like isoform X2 [Paramacrobiotus metropolitanus]|uniref:dynein axonemal assembly factor 10-like isoform X2 n=1 Tax=Paramacrobiotus metropolitanus TaxID=2943436 RepID=UPI002445706E|nr:dynein axonemal assembly factor 10-like isoform X2 [Paramacrobiotus metropolitanus]
MSPSSSCSTTVILLCSGMGRSSMSGTSEGMMCSNSFITAILRKRSAAATYHVRISTFSGSPPGNLLQGISCLVSPPWFKSSSYAVHLFTAMEKPQIILHHHQSLNYTCYDCKWIPFSPRFVVLGGFPRGTGCIDIFQMSVSEVKHVTQVEKAKSFKCGTFGASSVHERHLATGDFDGRLCVWDLEKPEMPVYHLHAHTQIINAIDGVGGLSSGAGAPEIVTGSRDGLVKLWDTRQKKDPVAVMAPNGPQGDGQTLRDCWTVAFGNACSPEERCVAAGYDNGDIKLFDLRTMSVRWETNHKNGVCHLEFDRKDINMNKLVATTLEQTFHVYDMRTQHEKDGFASKALKAHDSTIWACRHLPQNRDVFMTCGGEGSLSLWKYNYPTNRTREDSEGKSIGVVGDIQLMQDLKLGSQPISALDWSPDKLGLAVTTGFDQCMRIVIVTKLNRL